MAYYDFLNVIFYPILKLPTLWALLIISLFISLLITVITKYFTNQEMMKKIREDMKDLQKQSKESKNNPSRIMELQKKQMELTMEQFKHSLKPTLITFIPIIIIFGWMSSVFAYESIKPQQEFNVYAVFDKNVNGEAEIIVPEELKVIGDKKVKIEQGTLNKERHEKMVMWTLKGDGGEHSFEVSYNDERQQHDVLVTESNKYLPATKSYKGSIKSIVIEYKKNILLPIGYKDWFGWLGVYIWSSLIFTMALRKVMKVH